MSHDSSNYFRYFAPGPEANKWELVVTAAGFTQIPANSPYPPAPHPADHHFDWERGRILDAPQIVLITAGQGWLETRAAGRRLIKAGTAFVLQRRTWHRYRPDPATGWVESWTEIDGTLGRRLLRSKRSAPRGLCRKGGVAAGLEEALIALHELARRAGPGFDPELAAAGFRVLAVWEKMQRPHSATSPLLKAVRAAQQHLAEHAAEPVNIEALARKLGVAYTHFRRAFKAHTGFAPWQYVLHLRLSRAKRALAHGGTTLDEVAARFGFSSAFHFSAAFKQAHGVAPHYWRKQFSEGSRAALPER